MESRAALSASLSLPLSCQAALILCFSCRLPGLVEDYLSGKLTVDDYITHSVRAVPVAFSSSSFSDLGLLSQSTLTEINKGFEFMKSGDCIRCVVDMTK